MKNIKTLFLLLLISMSFTSCLKDIFCEDGKGDFLTETFIIDDFTGIELQEAANVTITQGPIQSVRVSAQENILDKLKTEVNGGVWDIDLGRDCFNDLELDIEITIPVIDEIHLSGSGLIEVGDFDDQDNIDMSVTGSGTIEVGQFTGTKDVDVKISGSGEIFARGAFPDLEKMNIEMTGSGNFDGFNISTNELDSRISGSGNIFITVQEYMNIRITGSGDLHYKGNPLIDANITGSGKIINEN